MGFEQYAIHLIRSNRNLQKRNSKHYFKQKTTNISKKHQVHYSEQYIGEEKDFSDAIYQKRLSIFKQLLVFFLLFFIFFITALKYANRAIVQMDNNYNYQIERIAENAIYNSAVDDYHFFLKSGKNT